MELEEAYNGNPAPGAQSGSAIAIIGAEDEDFENDIEPNPDMQSSLFQSLEVLKKHPAYLMVFLHHVALQFDSSSVLCYLHVDLIRHLTPKEGKKQFVEFCHNFLDRAGLLRIHVPTSVQFELDRSRPDLLPDDLQRKFLQDIQAFQEPEIFRQLEDFREKRKMGMTAGEPELSELESYQTKDKGIREAKEKQLAEILLGRLEEMHLTISSDEEKSSAIFSAIVTYMKYLGVKTKGADSKKSKPNFFRKKISGTKKPEETPKPKKGFSILDPARWNRGDSHYSDYRQSKPEGEAGDKALAVDKKGSKGAEGTSGRGKGTSSALDPPGVSVSVHPSAGEGTDGDQGLDNQGQMDSGDSPVMEQPVVGEQLVADDGTENERLTAKLGRSESLRVYERKRSQRGSAKGKQLRSRSDVDIEAAARANELEEKSSLDQARRKPGSGNLEPGGAGGGEPPPSFLLPQSEENEPRVSELELEPPNWRELIAPDTLLRLKKSEVKRQEVINELFITEHAHVRMLRVLLEVFYQPMLTEGFFDATELQSIFPALEDLVDEHKLFLEKLKKLREENPLVSEIGDTLLARFHLPDGSWFQKISARFCSRQSLALEQLKAKQKKEPRFNQFIQEAESQPRCRRLQLKDIIPIEMQRLTKYPLLLHNIAQCTEEKEEREKVQKAANCCREILNEVNKAVRETENFLKLKDYQRRLDLSNLKQSTDPLLSEFRNTDITSRKLVYEGPLTWRVTKDKSVDVHVLLLDDILVLLQKQEERLVLKCHSRTITPTPDGKQMLSPIIKLNSAMTREVATDRKAFYVIFSWENGAQIYELVAQTVSERKNWCSMISDTAGSLKLPATTRLKPHHSAPNQPSPSYDSEPLLGEAENGSQEAQQSEEREKDSPLGGAEFEEHGPLGEQRSSKAIEEFLADILPLYRPQTEGRGSLAAAAQERVLALKRLLQVPEKGEDSFPAEAANHPPENGTSCEEEEQDEWGRTDGTEAENSRRRRSESARTGGGTPNGPQEPEWSSEHLDREGHGCPVVLSHQQLDGVKHHLRLLEDAVQGLKYIEADYWDLQQLMGKLVSPEHPSFT